jgi:hypothetical protein
MNYIELLNNFWRLNKEYQFTSYETQLYFKILDISNSLGWKNPFNQSNALICAECSISEPKLISIRNKLKQVGLIDFESGKVKRQLTVYKILGLTTFSLNDSLNDSLNGSLNDSLNGVNRLDNNKHINKTKLNNVLLEKEPKAGFQFRAELLKISGDEKLVDDWLKVRKTKKATNSETALAGFLKQVEISKRPINEVLMICIQKDWKGFSASWPIESTNFKNNVTNGPKFDKNR